MIYRLAPKIFIERPAYIHVQIYIDRVHTYTNIYIYIERERERESVCEREGGMKSESRQYNVGMRENSSYLLSFSFSAIIGLSNINYFQAKSHQTFCLNKVGILVSI